MKKIFAGLFGLSVLLFFILMFFFSDEYLHSGALHLGIFSLAMFFLWKEDLKTTLSSLGIPGELKKNIIYSVGGMFFLLFILAGMFILLEMLGIENDSSNVAEIIRGLPWHVPLLAIFIAPISEELFFRGFLVPKIGVVGSAILFSISHLAYGSTVEIMGAFLVALIFGFIFRLSGSLTPCIIVHLAYNLLSISIMLVFR
jgi:hypothetical protein